MKRLNKEYKICSDKTIELIYGSTNKNNPQVIYISGKCWISPSFCGDYETILNNIKKEFIRYINKFIKFDKIFDNKFILDFDINIDSLNLNTKKYLSFNIFFKQKDEVIYSLKNEKLFSNFYQLSDKLEELLKSNDFEIYKRK